MPTAPSRDLIAYLRKLEGEAKVSLPWNSLDYPVTERVVKVPRGKAFLPFRTTPEPDTARYPNNFLTYQKELGGDRTHCEMYYRFERLPGPKISDTYTDDDTGQVMADIVWEDWNSSMRPARGSTMAVQLPNSAGALISYPDFIVLNCRRRPTGLLKAQFSAKTMRLPLQRVEKIKKGYTFPAIMKVFANREIVDVGTRTPMPWLGYNYTYLPPRSGVWTGYKYTTYSKGPIRTTMPPVFSVFSPAGNSRIFPQINEFTIHNEFQYFERGSNGVAYYVERFPASNPANYTPGQLICVTSIDEKWMGPIWRQTVEYIAETPLSISGQNWQIPATSQNVALVSGEPGAII